MMLNNNKHEKRFSRSKNTVSDDLVISPSPKPIKFLGSNSGGQRNKDMKNGATINKDKGLHVFVWSSTSSPTSDVNYTKHGVNRVGSADFGTIESSKVVDLYHTKLLPQKVKRNPLLESQQIARPFKAYTIVVCDTTV
ncbi:hypothetical protein JHK87_042491 [Glycine soja]|nr:hypothetical protein JHK87_042491 [Glycine soja]